MVSQLLLCNTPTVTEPVEVFGNWPSGFSFAPLSFGNKKWFAAPSAPADRNKMQKFVQSTLADSSNNVKFVQSTLVDSTNIVMFIQSTLVDTSSNAKFALSTATF